MNKIENQIRDYLYFKGYKYITKLKTTILINENKIKIQFKGISKIVRADIDYIYNKRKDKFTFTKFTVKQCG